MHISRKTAAVSCLVLAAVPAWAQDAGAAFGSEDEGGYLIGASMASAIGFIGSADANVDIKPMFSFQLGKVRISRSRANALLYSGRKANETGVSTALLREEGFSLGLSLRWDNGREIRDDPRWADLDDVRSTARVRLSARWTLTPHWTIALSGDHDILGRGGGGRLSTGVSYRHPMGSHTYWDFGLNVGGGNRKFMHTTYGVPVRAAATAGVPAYYPGGGLESVQASADVAHFLSRHWVMFGGVTLGRIAGPARHSPLIARVSTWGLTVGLAYRGGF
jgi:outer membrane protein